MRVLSLLVLAVLCLSAKGDRRYSKSDCKEIGYYIASEDAHSYYVERCLLSAEETDLAKQLEKALVCKGISELEVFISNEMGRRARGGGYMSTEQICSDPRR